jgi:ABC-type antimicrobial peptide transport system permease subunit
MSKPGFNLETALSTWRHQYKYSRAFKGRDLDELEQHLRDHVTWLMDSGHTAEQAFRQAVGELGAYHETESAYRSVAIMKTRDRREITHEISHRMSMFASYFRTAFRNLRKNKASSLINILSLSVAIAVTLVTFLLVSAFMTEDFYHENADEIFMVHRVESLHAVDDSASVVAPRHDHPAFQWYGTTPAPLGPAIAASSPDVVRAVRIAATWGQVHVRGEKLDLNVRFVDDGFFGMFSFPLQAGTDEAVREGGGVILSAQEANRIFGAEDPAGQSVTLQIGNGDPREYTVTGVAAPFRSNADLKFGALMSFAAQPADDWSTFGTATFLQLRSAHAARRVEAQLASLVAPVNASLASRVVGEDIPRVHGFALDNLKQLTRHRANVEDSIIGHFPTAPIVVLGGLSALLLLLACFNCMNITIAQAAKRLREIGVRKVVGAQRSQVVAQFLAENILLSVLALLVGLWLAWQFVLPAFNGIASLNLEFDLLRDWRLWGFLAALVLGTGLLSGLYPAVYVSSFRPTIIFRGMDRSSKRRPVTTALQGFQFVLAFLSLAAGITFILNGRYYSDRSAGYDTEQVVVFEAGSAAELDVLRTAATNTPEVDAWTTSQHAFGRMWNEETVRMDDLDRDVQTSIFGISPEFPELMDLELVAGRYEDAFAPDQVLANATFAQEAFPTNGTAFDPASVVGRMIRIDSTNYYIAGVVADFHFEDFFSVIGPSILRYSPPEAHRYLIARSVPGARHVVADRIAASYESAFVDRKADWYVQGDMFASFRRDSDGLTAIFLFVSFLTLIISCLSVYALSAQNILNRLNEVGVRKVFGGRSFGIAQRLNRKIVVVLTVAALISAPIGYKVMAILLGNLFAYHMEMSPLPFVVAFVVMASMTVLTIAIQVRAIGRMRPAEILAGRTGRSDMD